VAKVELPAGEEAFTIPAASGGCAWYALTSVEPRTGHTFADVRTFVSGTHVSGAVSGQAGREQITGVRRRRQNHFKKAGVRSAD
jgi:hypothetical protein